MTLPAPRASSSVCASDGECPPWAFPPLTSRVRSVGRGPFWEPEAFTLPSNLGASQRCDAVFMGAFCMFAFVVNHPWIAGLLLLAVLVSFAAGFVGDGHWSQPDVE